MKTMAKLEYALSIRPPWIDAIFHADKRIENRTYKPSDKVVGHWLALHASKTLEKSAVEELDLFGLYEFDRAHHHPGCIYGMVKVIGYATQGGEFSASAGKVNGYWDAYFAGDNLIEEGVFAEGETPSPRFLVTENPWWAGPVGWLFEEITLFESPVPATGSLGLWKLASQPEVLKGVIRELKKLDDVDLS
jgi:hypothetical protein